MGAIDVGNLLVSGEITAMEATPHPIFTVAGEPAQLSHALELQYVLPGSKSRDHAFSASVRNALTRAGLIANNERSGPKPVVWIRDFLRAIREVEPGKGGHSTVSAFLDVLAEYGPSGSGESSQAAQSVPAETQSDHSEEKPPDAVVMAPELTELLASAATIVRRVNELQIRVDMRHAVAALLSTKRAQEALWWDGFVEGDPDEILGKLAKAIITALERKDGFRDDEPERWQELAASLAHPQPDLRTPTPVKRSETSYVKDKPIESLDEDQLGFADEVRALARVICLKEPGPPLAVGLFGDWGSGKSSFMNMLEHAVDDVGKSTGSSDTARALFVSKVVHIRFNAWHYNEADLWASLTSEFFSQLRVGGHRPRKDVVYDEVLESVAKHVATASEEVATQTIKVNDARNQTEKLRGEIEKEELKRTEQRAEHLSEAVKAGIDELGNAKLVAALKAIGVEGDLDADNADIAKLAKTEVERALGFGGKLATMFRAAKSMPLSRSATAGWVGLPILAAFVLFLVSYNLSDLFPEELIPTFAAAFGKIASAATVVLGPLFGVYRVVAPAFRVARIFSRTDNEKAAETQRDIEAKQSELREKESELQALTTKLSDAESRPDRFRGLTPDRLLEFYLLESEATRAFDEKLGTVSRVRAAFEKLDSIMAEGRRAKEKSEQAGENDVADAKFEPPSDEFQIDRIILYIDDLDRCKDEQVMKVLEAVHLLLAFDLFVVVVGVDNRHLVKALTNQLKLSENGARDGRTATPKDYLEKIFQIPIRLGRMSTTDAGFSAFVDQIAGPREAADAPVAPAPEPAAGEARMTIAPSEPKVDPLKRVPVDDPEEMLLTEPERELVKTLGPLMGKSPRAVKKFINLYRILRGLRRGGDLTRFLEPCSSEAPNYAAVQFWLAADCGLSSEQFIRLSQTVALEEEESVSEMFGFIEPLTGSAGGKEHRDRNQMAKLRPKMAEFWQATSQSEQQGLIDAFGAMHEALPTPHGVAALKAAIRETRRFSASF